MDDPTHAPSTVIKQHKHISIEQSCRLLHFEQLRFLDLSFSTALWNHEYILQLIGAVGDRILA